MRINVIQIIKKANKVIESIIVNYLDLLSTILRSLHCNCNIVYVATIKFNVNSLNYKIYSKLLNDVIII